MKQKLHLMLKGAMFFKALVVMFFAFAATGYAQSVDGVNATEYTIEDGAYDVYENSDDIDLSKLIYKRTLLPAGTWNALYVPFEIPVSALGDDYDVAYYNNIHSYDRDNNGIIESMEMDIILIQKGTLYAHHPYFIRAKNKAAENMSLELTNAKLLQTDDADDHIAIKTSSVYLYFTLTGTYNTSAEVEAFPTGIHYAIAADGCWSKVSIADFNPFRAYLAIAYRNTDQQLRIEAQAWEKMRIHVVGEEDTAIDEVEVPISGQSLVVYDLQGRRVVNTEGLKGIYIVNGKKVAF